MTALKLLNKQLLKYDLLLKVSFFYTKVLYGFFLYKNKDGCSPIHVQIVSHDLIHL